MSRYATVLDLHRLSMPEAAFAGIGPDEQQAVLDTASAKAEGYLRSRYSLPLRLPYPDDLVQVVCDLGAYLAMKRRGFNPEGDESVVRGYEDAISWLEGVARGLINPGVIEAAPERGSLSILTILSKPPRGW